MKMMRYDTPSENWMEGLPIGNGRLAAMVCGSENTDKLVLNHEWLWRGVTKDRTAEENSQYLPLVRKFLKDKDYFRAGIATNLFFGGIGGASGIKDRIDCYQVAGEAVFEIYDFKKYISRNLNINTGIVNVKRETANGCINSKFLANCESNLLVSSWNSENKTKFSGKLSFSRTDDAGAVYEHIVSEEKLIFNCSFEGGIKYSVVIHIDTDGAVLVSGNSVVVSDATYFNTLTNILTSVSNDDYDVDFSSLNEAEEKHIKKFSAMMNRVELSLDKDAELDNLTTDERIAKLKNGESDNGILELYFDYGRYLMISSAICGNLPANLQGKWNDRIAPPWGSDYHLNINLQMNYWLTEMCDLPECAQVLINYIERMAEKGEESAKNLYGCRGMWLPLSTDAWAAATPEAYGYAAWIGAAPWLMQHVWWHYTYSGDMDFLKERAYPLLKSVAEFYEDYLIEDEEGVMQIAPSQSPENRFVGAGDIPISICTSSSMDVQLAYDALNYAILSSKILSVDDEQRQIWEKLRDNLPEFKIGTDGRLLEWNEEFEECEPGHRHLSHLYGLYPSDLFTPERNSKQYEAAIKSLDYRLVHDGGYTGWSRAWTACMYARIGDKPKFYEHFTSLVKTFATSSLLDLHPPGIFQIDGNFGAVAAVVEAIVSCTDNKVHLLRGLPKEWKNGSLKGVKVPGGHKLDVIWSNGRVEKLNIVFGYTESVTVCMNGESHEFNGDCGEERSINL